MDQYRNITGQIFERIITSLFDQPIMGNIPRSHYAEHMVEIGLGTGFSLTSADWAPWDINHETGAKIEVKQSAATQTWSRGCPSTGRFDIAPRNGYWTDGGGRWVEKNGRHADIFIFCWHPGTGCDQVDHRAPDQWIFFVVPEAELPAGQKSISCNVLAERWPACSFKQLRDATMTVIGSDAIP